MRRGGAPEEARCLRLTRGGLFTLALIAGAAAAGPPGAALVLRGGQIYTVDAARTWASAVAIKDGRIACVGDDRRVTACAGRGARVVELQGRMVLPGFHDSHLHPVSGGLRLVRCQLQDAASVDRLHAAVRACAADSPRAERRSWRGATGQRPP